METMEFTPNPEKKMISLALGDPTVYKNLNPAPEVVEAVRDSLIGGLRNGYGPSTGFVDARQAVADYVSVPGAKVTADDVILCSGCSCALDIAISTMADAGKNILVPRPGFPIYTTLSAGQEIETREYNLLPNQDWEADLEQMEAMIDQNTAAIIVNSPSNPCGSVFSVQHLKDILAIAEKYKVPIIADEIYEHFLVPGWRLGWIIINDRNHVFDQEIRRGLMCMSQRIIGSNTFIQGALPTILKKTPTSFFENAISVIKDNADLAFTKLRNSPGLIPIMPRGAMYMMVKVDMDRFPQFNTDLEFIERLVSEESVQCMPGKCFNYPGYMRLVLTLPRRLLNEALDRIHSFCSRNLLCPPPSRLVNLLVENRSLYATYGKRYGQFVDNPHVDNWHNTWQLAVVLAEAMNRKGSISQADAEAMAMEVHRKNSQASMAKYKDSAQTRKV